MTGAISRPSAGWMGPRSFRSKWRRIRRIELCSASPHRTFSTLSNATVAFGRHPHACTCGSVGRRVSHQGERRNCRGDRAERGTHGTKRYRLRASRLGARVRCGAGGLNRNLGGKNGAAEQNCTGDGRFPRHWTSYRLGACRDGCACVGSLRPLCAGSKIFRLRDPNERGKRKCNLS
jgi:hypothetical protein